MALHYGIRVDCRNKTKFLKPWNIKRERVRLVMHGISAERVYVACDYFVNFKRVNANKPEF